MADPSSPIFKRIKRLDNRLANQIAAGEVVERPASVVKELLENSIDAGASRIEVDIERGGTRLIRVTDNGCGVVKEDLSLALSRHATSKISTSSDLAAIDSLGFRGEALASISSVSRLCFTSRTEDSDFAWQANAEGRDMLVDIQPASATIGSRIEVRDLFYNTPARQKFLRAEKTEFGHIEEIFKRHALANFETAFILKHNHKVVKRVPAGSDPKDYLRRIESICGKAFAEQTIPFECQHDGIKITGWLGGVNFHRSESDIQYVFINGRPVKDKMLNHAIRQSYQGLLPPGRMPTFVIFLSLDPAKIDVNVHPTKHEVRFDEQRMVHDLLVKSVSDALGGESCLASFDDDLKPVEPLVHQSDPIQSNQGSENQNPAINYHHSKNVSVRNRAMGVGYSQVSYQSTYSKNIVNTDLSDEPQKEWLVKNKLRLENGIWIVLIENKAYLVDEQELLQQHLTFLINVGKRSKEASEKKRKISKPLLFPHKIKLDRSELEELSTLELLKNLGFIFEPAEADGILLQQIPNWLIGVDKQIIFNCFAEWIQCLVDKNFAAVYCSIQPMPSQMFDHLLNQSGFCLATNHCTKTITADLAKRLLVGDKPL